MHRGDEAAWRPTMPTDAPLKELKFKTLAQYRRLVASLPTEAAAGSDCRLIRVDGRPTCSGRCRPGKRCALQILEFEPFLVVQCFCVDRR
jgi:hypothetical protein